MTRQGSDFSNLVSLLQYRAEKQGDMTAYVFLTDGETREKKITYGQLDRKARAIAATLQNEFPFVEKALLIYPSGLEFLCAFFGCLYAGTIATLAYTPKPNRSSGRLSGIVRNSKASVALTTKKMMQKFQRSGGFKWELASLKWVTSETIDRGYSNYWQEPSVSGQSLALIQYTSGSSGFPKGVMVTHKNLFHNSAFIRKRCRHTTESRHLSWLPHYHDMGLMGAIVEPMYVGFPAYFMSPGHFIQKPFRWVENISRLRITTSGGPNFAYDLCTQKIRHEQCNGLDLRSWDLAYNGAEPIRSESLERFARVFESYGFRKEAFFPCYGMAEATLFISGGLKQEKPKVVHVDKKHLEQNRVAFCNPTDPDAQGLVGCGRTWLDQTIRIVDPETSTPCPDHDIGEIWVKGPNVAQGYWNNPEETEKTFRAYLAGTGEGPFLRTGDLGFMIEEELYVTGRIKDLIIIHGRNHYPQDIELTVERCHETLRPGCGAAFSISGNHGEKLVVVQEVRPEHAKTLDKDQVFECIKRAVSKAHELRVHAIALIRARTIPKTSSGKIQRKLCKRLFMEDRMKVIKKWHEKESDKPEEAARKKKHEGFTSAGHIQNWLVKKLAASIEIAVSDIDVNASISAYGLDSVDIAEMQGEISDLLDVKIPQDYLMRVDSLAKLSLNLFGLAYDQSGFNEDDLLENIDNLSESEIDALLKAIK